MKTDNCALPSSANMNYPLRGGQFTQWEGGIRTHAFVLPLGSFMQSNPSTYSGIVSITDWKATLIAAAGVSSRYVPSSAAEAKDSMNLWDAITGVSTDTERTTAMIHVWKENQQYVLLFRKESVLYKMVAGIATKAEGGG
jgi:hypothetical protein